MLVGDELEDLDAVADRLQQERAQRVRQRLGLAFEQVAVAQHAAQLDGGDYLRPDLLVAAGRGDDDRRPRTDSPVDGVVGRRVARVERDEHVGARQLQVVDEARTEFEPFKARAPRDLVAEFDQLRARLDARDRRAHAAHIV